MANMWIEEMDRRAIYKRSLAEDTSIDPTDSPQNMQAFLSRIHSAFDASHTDHEDSRLGLSVVDGDVLALKITCDITGLQPLVWPMSFKKGPPSQVGTKLVLPLLQADHVRIKQVNALLDVIQQKDAVMTKLLDKLESSGTRLENIFTVLSAKQRVSRQIAEDKVKGLAPFKRNDWEIQLSADNESPQSISDLFKAVLEAPLAPLAPELIHSESPALDDWWTKLSAGHVIPIIGPKKPAPRVREETPPPKSLELDDGDDFQVQSTPPHLSSARKRAAGKQAQPHADDESTEDEDDEQKLPQPSHHPKQPEKITEPARLEKKSVVRKLGQIGKKAAANDSSHMTSESRGRTAERTEEEAKPRETSQDRANRKRDELQKELQKKATAGPARKKRKF
ncbi:hypothetical protein ACHAQA_004840 [Verticillium albo-atrum]